MSRPCDGGVQCDRCGVEFEVPHDLEEPTKEERAENARSRARYRTIEQIFRDGGQPLADLVTRHAVAARALQAVTQEIQSFVEAKLGEPVSRFAMSGFDLDHFVAEIPEELLGPDFYDPEEAA